MKSTLKFNAILFMVAVCMAFFTGCTKEEESPYIIERGSVTDVDGNIYETVKIGNQWWMAENLRVTAFNDGTPISYLPVINGEDSTWASIDSAAYCFINDSLFGCLYNAHTFNNGKNVAPAGWHVPTDDEWRELERTLGMSDDETRQTGWRGVSEANALAAQYNVGWPANDQSVGLYGSNYYGFNALPSNVRGHDGRTNIQNNSAWWWCNSASDGQYYYRSIDTYHRRIFRQVNYPTYGMSIRCIKD